MTERERQVVALLRLVDEWVPGPRISRVYSGSGRSLDGEVVSDDGTAYAARFGGERRIGWQRRDAEIRRLELARKHEAGLVDARELEPWEAAKLGVLRGSSLRELLVLLVALEAELGSFSLTALRVVHGYVGDLRFGESPLLKREAEVALAWVAARMPDPIVLPDGPAEGQLWASRCGAAGRRGERAREERDLFVRELAGEGVAQSVIGLRVGLGQPAVSKILRRKAGEVAA